MACSFPFTYFPFISALTAWFYVTRPHMEVRFPTLMVLIIAILNDGLYFVTLNTHSLFQLPHACIFLLIFFIILKYCFCVWFSILNSLYGMPGTIMTISKDRVKPSPQPDSWKLLEIFATGIILGSYLDMMTVIFFLAEYDTDIFPVR